MEALKLLVLRLTERCNLRCRYCYAARADGPACDMDERTALRAVELCCPPGGSMKVQFTGGEPLLMLERMEAVAAFGRSSGRRLTLSVQTNATLLTPDVCRRLKALRCGVGVSLDGAGAANALRTFPDGTASFDAAVRGIGCLGRAGMRCGMTAVVTCVNAARLGQLFDLALCLGNVAGIGLDLFRPLGRGSGQALRASPEQLASGLRDLLARVRRAEQAGLPFRLREAERLRARRARAPCGGAYCYAQTGASLAVDGRGDCWPCSSLAGQAEHLLGNLRDGLPALRPGAGRLAAGERCKTCARFPLCLGGCPAGRAAGGAADELTCVMQEVLQGSE